MAIVKMNKFMLLAFENQKKSLLEKLQSFQNVQFLDLSKNESSELNQLKSDSASSEISEVEGELSKVKFIIELLSTFSEKPKLLKDLKEGKKSYSYDVLEQITSTSHWHEVYSDLKQKDNKINMNHNYITKLKANIEELKPWESLDTSVESINVLKKSKAILGEIPQGNVDSLRLKLEETTKNYYFEVISSIGRNSYIMVIAHNDDLADIEQLLKSSSFSKIDIQCDGVPKEVIKEYKKTIESINTENNFIQEGMKEHVNKLEEYKVVYEYYSSLLLRLKSTENFLKSKNIVAIEGYYPSELHNDFQSTLKSILGDDYYLESESAEGDDVPVKLKNNKVFESFENITSMYSVPKYKEIDPTPLLAPFYIFFFGMMLSDAGYGLVMFVGTLIALTTFNLDGDTRKSIKMFFLLSISTIFWGIMYGSYFGDFIKIAPLWMKPDSNVGLLMIVSVVMGLIQIYVGLGIKAYMQIRDKDYFGAFADVGLWYITLTGAIIWALSAFVDLASLGVPAVIIAIAKYGTIAGMVGIVLTNGRQESSIGGKLGQGFYALYGITSYVGDLVSYTRLAALGLATGFIAYAFNIMVSMVSTSWATIIFGVAIFVVGHVFNLFINALGAYVHTCRLQYLEYFGKFYEGGGTSFKPLKYNSKYFKISK
ncbi:ATP synthase subunit I [Clostridium sulfidigenes]|uniref:ATP synthase subunit I n=1 Tax=Clostridium sulfidigenes TaxID=318464 RepID=A0A084JDZ9_9CLOT|nr:V-type ATP synthase subunit I [Clostridium sulfidigenes]KEZ87183.1 ATP synthase subunit I [Clostridium sulfidigenes]